MRTTAYLMALNEYAEAKEDQKEARAHGQSLASLTAKDLMTAGVVTVPASDTIKDAVRLFIEERVTALAVVDKDDNPIGVFSETDLARYERQRPDYLLSVEDIQEIEAIRGESYPHSAMHVESVCNDLISDWMSPRIISVDSGSGIGEICSTLAKNHIHRVFVKQNQRLLGVVSTMDIVTAFAA